MRPVADTPALAPTGEQYSISGAGYHAVLTQSGAALRLLTHTPPGGEPRELTPTTPPDAMPGGGNGQLLMPWPNRIRDGHYTVDGVGHQLALSDPARGNASHGLVRWAAWHLLEHDADRIRLGYRVMAQTGYPWTLDLEAEYRLDADGLTVIQRAVNRSATPAPYASGAHPYLTLPGRVDDWQLGFSAGTAVRTDDRKLPRGERPVPGTELDFAQPRRVGELAFDTCFGDLARDADGRTWVRVEHGDDAVCWWADADHRWLMLFTGEGGPYERQALAVEPMTAPVDAFNSGTGLRRLAPGERFAASWGIRVDPT